MKTSVIIPTVDRRENLNVPLRSLARQTLLPDEVVVVEQGDVEQTRKSAASLPFPVKILAHGEKSAATARNRGVGESTGEVLFFFDDDIEISPDYLQTAIDHLRANPGILGLTGLFEGEAPRPRLRLMAAYLFNIHSPRARNIVLASGSYDFIRGAHADEEQTVEWMRGGNMVLRRRVFDEGFLFNPHFKKWSFGEDAWITYRIHKRHPGSLKFLPALRVRHHQGAGRMTSGEMLKMRVVYRYLFWKGEVWQRKFYRTWAFLWSQIGLALLDLSQNLSLNTLRLLVRSHTYLAVNRGAILAGKADFNSFIFGDRGGQQGLWRVSVFGIYPFVRLRQMIAYPPFFFSFLKKIFYDIPLSRRFISKYAGFKFLAPRETLRRITEGGMSLARFGDGDIEQLTGAGEYPPDSDWSQRASAGLARKIGEVLGSRLDNLLIAPVSPGIFLKTRKEAREARVITNMWVDTRRLLWRYLHKDREYGDANVFIPAHHPEMDWRGLKKFLREKTVLVVTGGVDALSDIVLGRKTFFIEAGKHDAFERYDAIRADIDRCIRDNALQKGEILIMASLGPTAAILAHDLCQKGVQVWDTGHIFKFARAQLTGGEAEGGGT